MGILQTRVQKKKNNKNQWIFYKLVFNICPPFFFQSGVDIHSSCVRITGAFRRVYCVTRQTIVVIIQTNKQTAKSLPVRPA